MQVMRSSPVPKTSGPNVQKAAVKEMRTQSRACRMPAWVIVVVMALCRWAKNSVYIQMVIESIWSKLNTEVDVCNLNQWKVANCLWQHVTMLCLAHHEVEAQKDQHSPHVFTCGNLGSDPAWFSLVPIATAWHEETHVMTDSADALSVPRDGDQANTPANAPFLCLSSDARQRKDARLRHMALGQDPVFLVNMPNRIGIVFGGMFTYSDSVFGWSWPML